MTVLKPMLAKPFKASSLRFPIYLQPKLDGMRAIWTGTQLLSRTGKEIKGVPNLVEHLREHYSDFPLDGELYNHEKTFQEQISSVRRTVNIQEDLSIQYHIYDLPIPHHTFQERLRLLQERVQETDRIKLVETVRVIEGTGPDNSILVDPDNLLNRFRGLDWFLFRPEENERTLNIFEHEGYEGTMVRNSMGVYTLGKRSSDLMKVKTFQDEEFECVGFNQLTRKEKIIVPEGTPGSLPYADGTWYKDGEETPDEMVGDLIVQLPDGNTCKVGSGYTEEQRREFWKEPPIGKKLTIKFQGYTDPDKDGKVSLRFPVFKGIRIEDDLPEEE